jgi:hypothetical protein
MKIASESEEESFFLSCSLFIKDLNLSSLSTQHPHDWLASLSSSIDCFLQSFSSSSPSRDQYLLTSLLDATKHIPHISSMLSSKILEIFRQFPNEQEVEIEDSLLSDFRLLQKLQLCDYYFPIILRILKHELHKHVFHLIHTEYSLSNFLPQIHQWISSHLLLFCKHIFSPLPDPLSSSALSLRTPHPLRDLSKDLIQYSYQALLTIRSKELFDIIINYPDSTPALLELKQCCLLVPSSLVLLGKDFKHILSKRLLHIGASTSQIIDFYISLIRSLRILDPSNLLLNHVAISLRRYLINRTDTIRCIISLLTGDKKEDFQNEFHDGGLLEYGLDSDDETAHVITAQTSDDWSPPLRIKDFTRFGQSGGSGDKDILAILVSIYGSTDLFVSEYRSILADRLLGNLEYDIDNEVATLELLKLRFGEESLHSCEVMLHDLETSKRINHAIQQKLSSSASTSPQDMNSDKGPTLIDCAIVSDSYWPSLQADPFTHHPTPAALLQEFIDSFAVVKKPKLFTLLPQLGQVTIELEFKDGNSKEYLVNPIQATMIHYLADNDSDTHSNSNDGTHNANGSHSNNKSDNNDSMKWMSLSKLSSLCNLSVNETRQWMQLWVSKGVVKETSAASLSVSLEGEGQEQGELEIGYEIIENQAERERSHRNDLEVPPFLFSSSPVLTPPLFLSLTEQLRITRHSSTLHRSFS